MSDIIGSVTVTPPAPRPGESALVEVRGPDGTPITDPAIRVMIAGVPGAVQHLQFPKAGPRHLGVYASGPDGEDRKDVEIDVEGEPLTFIGKQGKPELAMVGVTQSQTSPYTAILTLGSTADSRAVAQLRPLRPVRGALKFVSASTAARRIAPAGAAARRAAPTAALERLITEAADIAIEPVSKASGPTTFVAQGIDVAHWRDLLQTQTRTYTWDFGDGATATTHSPVVQHDYFAAIDHAAGVGSFDVTVSVSPGDVQVQRTLTIYSAYAMSRATGVVVPHTVGDLFAHKKYTQVTGSFVVHNVEGVPLVLDRMSITPVTDDPDAAGLPGAFRALAHPIQVAAHGATSIGVNVPFVTGRPESGQLPYDMRGFTVIYAGSAGDLPVRTSYTFDIPVEEWDDRPHQPSLPDVPPLVQKVWPWEMVEHWWGEQLTGVGAVVNPAEIVLDDVTGSVAIPLESLAAATPREAERAIDKVFAGVYAPIQAQALAAGQLSEVATRRLTRRLAPLAARASASSAQRIGGVQSVGDVAAAQHVVAAPAKQRITAAQHVDSASMGTRASTLDTHATSTGIQAGTAVAAQADTAAVSVAAQTDAAAVGIGTRARKSDRHIATELLGTAELERVQPVASLFGKRTFHTLDGDLPGPPPPGPIEEGSVCDPDNLTEDELALAENGQLVCQLTDEAVDVLMPARWMNARRGDVILAPGGDGIIGGLMLRVTPPQLYSHSGIMTRNFDEIAHSTGSQDRLMDHQIGFTQDGSDGFDPDTLKFMWPGAIRQSVQDSTDGSNFPDPDDSSKKYSIAAFGKQTVGITHNDQLIMIPPLVLKPDPLLETAAVRSTLHTIADAARADAGTPGVIGKYHYRFFCYTDPTIGLDDAHGPATGWAAGTRPSVCSSFIWMHARDLLQLEGPNELVVPADLEAKDVTAGASVSPDTIDGLYRYTAAERLTAGEWLYQHIYDMAYDKAGWFGTLLTDAPDDVASQFLNVFANDNGDGKDSDAWRNTQDANAVSPDDMMWWDGPDLGGVYGFVEPAIYREPRVETYTVSRWKKVITRGKVHGRVFADGALVGGASVSLYGDKTDMSDANGVFSIDDVPLGNYMLKASKVIDGALHSVQLPIELTSDDLAIDVVMQPPDERFRLAQVFIDFRGVDEENFGDNEIDDPGPEYYELELGPSKLSNSLSRTYKWGGEVRAEYGITVKLLVGNIIDVVVNGKLYEGTSEDTDDLDGQGSVAFQVPIGGTGGTVLRITNTDEDDDDEGRLSISVTNARNDN